MAKVLDKINFAKMRSGTFFGLLGLLSIAFLYLIRPFFYPIFWAAVLAVMFHPLYAYVLRATKMPNVSALLSLIVAFVAIFVPLSLIAVLLFHESVTLYESIVGGRWGLDLAHFGRITEWLQTTPFAPYIQTIQSDWTTHAANATKFLTLFVFDNIKSISQNSAHFIFLLFITLYTLFFFFRDGVKMLKRLQHLSPLGDNHEIALYNRFTSTARATLKSTVIVGGVQGILGGLLFWATGVEGAFIWGVIMLLLSLVPGIGAFLVWLPTGVIMLLMGNVWQGLSILLVGSMVISTIDNLLRPPLIGKDTQMHPLIVLFSTLGGIFLFGVSGFIIGPVLSSLYLAIISIYDNYYIQDLKHNE
jgi:predicted PurR-regulated permease PerM